jgi:hypothetical protein
LEIVELEDEEEDQVWQLELNLRHSPQIEHDKEDRHLHETPTYLVVDSRTPLLRTHLAITSIYEVECYEYNQPNKG